MSGTITTTIPALPSAIQNAQSLLAAMAARTLVLTDLNPGSIIRTIAESEGAVIEEQGEQTSSLVYQAINYGAYSAFGIIPYSGSPATGQITFSTLFGGSAPATQNIPIPSGTIVQTPGGTQFQTLNNVVLVSGGKQVTVCIDAIIAGTGGNVAASAINQIINGLSYPLFCLNPTPTSGGANAELPSQTATRFAAAVALPGLCSPLAIANAAIGVVVSGTGEVCYYSALLEPWITGGPSAQNLGWILFVDNGTGSASTQLLAAVSAKIQAPPQYRDAGVPWGVSAAVPVTASVSVTGTLNTPYVGILSTVSGAIASGITNYFASLQFGQLAEQPQIAAAIGNAVPGVLSSLAVTLNAAVSAVVASPSGRVILSSLTIGLS